MTGDAKREPTVADSSSPARQRVAERIRQLYVEDEQFRNTKPDPSLQRTARRQGCG